MPRTTGRVRVLSRRLLLALACPIVAFSGLTGCSNNNRAAMDQLTLENQELRERRDELASALDECDAKYNALVQEREGLVAENERLRTAAAARPAQPSGVTGLPSGVEASFRDSELVLTVAGDVLFASGQTTLRNEARRTLNELADVIRSRYGGNMLRIAGHTDSDPIRRSQWKTNERLSAERALAVEEYLASRGIPKDRMYIAGFGDAMPRGSKAQSRRVEIIVLNAR